MQSWLDKISHFFKDLFKSFFDGLVDFVKDIFTAIFDLIKDSLLWLLDGFLSAISTLLKAIPAPDFLINHSLGSLINGFPPFALFVINNLGIGDGLAIIASGVGFFFLRKLFTLGQW